MQAKKRIILKVPGALYTARHQFSKKFVSYTVLHAGNDEIHCTVFENYSTPYCGNFHKLFLKARQC